MDEPVSRLLQPRADRRHPEPDPAGHETRRPGLHPGAVLGQAIAEAASFSLNATSLYFTCLANGNSRFYHSKQLYQCLREAHFHVEAEHEIPGPGHTLLVARPLHTRP